MPASCDLTWYLVSRIGPPGAGVTVATHAREGGVVGVGQGMKALRAVASCECPSRSITV